MYLVVIVVVVVVIVVIVVVMTAGVLEIRFRGFTNETTKRCLWKEAQIDIDENVLVSEDVLV